MPGSKRVTSRAVPIGRRDARHRDGQVTRSSLGAEPERRRSLGATRFDSLKKPGDLAFDAQSSSNMSRRSGFFSWGAVEIAQVLSPNEAPFEVDAPCVIGPRRLCGLARQARRVDARRRCRMRPCFFKASPIVLTAGASTPSAVQVEPVASSVPTWDALWGAQASRQPPHQASRAGDGTLLVPRRPRLQRQLARTPSFG
jgi:hypothetical protein